jgi:membrane peptidoglycan carboxypeptidase
MTSRSLCSFNDNVKYEDNKEVLKQLEGIKVSFTDDGLTPSTTMDIEMRNALTKVSNKVKNKKKNKKHSKL